MAAGEQRDEIEALEKQVETWKILEGDKLLECLSADRRSDLERHVERFQQCKSMEQLGSLKELSEKISSLPETCHFYIGHAGKAIANPYLWDTCPKSKDWEKWCDRGKTPAKTYTYFTHLNENDNQTEHDLIKEWKGDKRCLNRTSGGIADREGIVYVLVYEYVDK